VKAKEDVTRRLAEYAADISYESLPPEVGSTLKRLVLDTLGTTLAGNTLGAGCRETVDVARGAGGSSESTLIGFGDKVPAALAAFANGAMAHALNYDAIGPEGGHLGAIQAAPLAVAELVGRVSGKEFLAALAAGAEVTARLAVAAARNSRGAAHPNVLEGQLLGYFGAGLGAGRVMRLTVPEMHSVLGLALMQAAGTMQVVLDGDPPAKAIYAAFPNLAGVLSALLSRQGLRGECAAFEGEAGLFATYYGGRYSRPVLDSQLGEKFHMLDVRFKPWPTSGVAHVFIEAAFQLMENHATQLTAIDHVEIRGGSGIRPFCEPVTERQKPANAGAAANSVFFTVAKALANGDVTLADFTPEGLRQPEAMRIAERMGYSIDDTLGTSGVVEVATVTGQHYVGRVDTPLGHPARPLTQAQTIGKFRECARYADAPIPKEALDEVIELVDQLERVPDVSVLPALVSPTASRATRAGRARTP
jgi:2-methylcitrate dehydratase PrpD